MRKGICFNIVVGEVWYLVMYGSRYHIVAVGILEFGFGKLTLPVC